MNEELVKCHTLSDSAVKLEIELKATPDRAYAAWTTPDQLVKWYGPRDSTRLEIDQFDCFVGGHYDVTMVFSDGDRAQMQGVYQELVPPNKIIFTWQWTENSVRSGETLVTVDLLPIETGTRLTLTHERFVTTTDRDNHQQGWSMLFIRLAALLTS